MLNLTQDTQLGLEIIILIGYSTMPTNQEPRIESGAGSGNIDFTAILAGDRQALAKAITLIESTREDHYQQARTIVEQCLPHTGKSFRIGITGAPGVGKSTFIDALGMHLTASGHKVAVLAVDPSSVKSGGSILGDKTRMERLSREEHAFVRPSPTSGKLGGIANKTREVMLLCEAAGFDIILIETVGVGQSEFSVHGLVDALVLLLMTGAGDDLQGIKRGIMEMADLIVIHKADGDNIKPANQLKRTLKQITHALPAPRPNWATQVLTASSQTLGGIETCWNTLQLFAETMHESGEFETNRSRQAVDWMHRHFDELLRSRYENDASFLDRRTDLERRVAAGEITPVRAAEELLSVRALRL